MKYTGSASYQSGSMIAVSHAPTRRFDPDEFNAEVIDEGVEDADGIAASAHAGNYVVGKLTLRCCYLLPGLSTDY